MKSPYFFRRIVLCFTLSYAFPFQDAAAQTDTLSFMHVTDTHLIFSLERYESDIVSRRKHYSNGILPLSRLLDSVSAEKDIRFVAITGDLVDFYGATNEKKEVKTYQIERFVQLVNQYPVPVFLNLGNHDIASYGWNGERMTSSQKIAGKARAAWIRSADAFRDGTYYSHIFDVGPTQYRLIFLENGYNSAGELEKTKPPYLDRIQLEWLKEQLQESPDDVEIVLMHIPFGEDAAGGEFYEVLSEHPTARLILAGHQHQNKVRGAEQGQRPLQVQTAAFARNPAEWRKISLTPEAILVSYPGVGSKYEVRIPVRP